MSHDFPDGPDYDPEPPDADETAEHDPDPRCPDCQVGFIEVGVGCSSCGLTCDDLLAADEMLAVFIQSL